MTDLDNSTPGGVYLCQINDDISCGACCGLYNVSDPSYENLYNMLGARTELFEKTERDYDSLIEFQTLIKRREGRVRPFQEFHHCHYLGLIGDGLKRPGCLLHPLGKGNNNVDHRGLSHWGGFACASYFCPTCSRLPARYKEILRLCANDWQLYGLVVTETEMLDVFFSIIEKETGKPLLPDEFKSNKRLCKSVGDFFRLKNSWPFRPEGFMEYGNYFFKDDLYPRKIIPYQFLKKEQSVYDSIFRALGSEFKSASEVEKGEEIINDLIRKILSSLKAD